MRFGWFVCNALLLPVAALAQQAVPAGRMNPDGPMISAGTDPPLFYCAGKQYSRGAPINPPVGGKLRCAGDGTSGAYDALKAVCWSASASCPGSDRSLKSEFEIVTPSNRTPKWDGK